jgi:hypothetical protein
VFSTLAVREKTLDAAAGVLRASAIESVRQYQHQAALVQPLACKIYATPLIVSEFWLKNVMNI